MTDTQLDDDRPFEATMPAVRHDAIVRHFDNEIVAWSPDHPHPAYLAPLAALVFQLLDGTASVAELVADVHDVVGVPAGVARNQIRRVVTQLGDAQLLATSHPRLFEEDLDEDLGVFPGPPNP